MPRTKTNGQRTMQPKSALSSYVEAHADSGKPSDGSILADWSQVDAYLIIEFVVAVTKSGGAVLLGTDTTGFGYTLSVYDRGKKVAKWFRPEPEGITQMMTFMQELINILASAENSAQ